METRDVVTKVDVGSGTLFKDVSPMLGSKMRERIALYDESRRLCPVSRPTNTPPESEQVSQQQLEERFQQYMDAEDKRVSEVAEGILYDFLPAAFDAIIPACSDPRTELSAERCKLVATAALSVGALLNCPPPLLEFLMRIPWQSIEELLQKTGDHEWIAEQLEISDETRLELLNTPIHPTLIPAVLEFVFSESYQSSAPFQLCPPIEGDRLSHLEKVAALLDGACALHCAALRGNPAQVGHLLNSGSDALQKTVIGDLPIELVPYCGDRTSQTHKKICRCMTSKEQEFWGECRSNNARTLIARSCILSMKNGVIAWLKMVLLCVLSWIGFWGCHENLCGRMEVIKHVEELKKAKSDQARFECMELLNALRKQVEKGHQLLNLSKQQNPLQKKTTSREDNVTENAVLCFAHAIQYLQSLEAKNEGKECAGVLPSAVSLSSKIQFPELQLPEIEKADVYSSWAESVLYKFKFCRCAGCAALAVQAVRMAHVHCAEILEKIENQEKQDHEKWSSVGTDLMKIIYIHICLLVETEAHRSSSDSHRSATKASVWRAEQCLNEWRHLKSKGYLSNGGPQQKEEKEISELDGWVQTAESDLLLAEALYGDDLTPSQTIKEVLVATVTQSPSGLPYLIRPSALDNLTSIEDVLKRVKSPSPDLASLTREVMENGKKEINAQIKLKESLSSKSAQVALGSIKKLSEAILEASMFPRLSEEVSVARKLQQQLRKRADAIEKLEEIMIQVKQPIPINNNKQEETSEESLTLSRRIQSLEAGIEQGKQAKINIEKAKRLLRDLQNQMSAVGAAYQLDKLIKKKPCGSIALKTALAKAESCYALTSSSLTTGLLSMSEFLLPRIQSSRKRLEVEKVVESLNRATSMYKSVLDLSKLESQILEARKLGAEDLDPAAFNAARALRGTLDTAGKLKQQLETGTKQVQKQQRESDVLSLEDIIKRASEYWNLIKDEIQKAQEVVENWRRIQDMEGKLNDVMKHCGSSIELSKTIQEANTIGAKIQGAKRALRLIQNLENGIKKLDSSLENCEKLKVSLEEIEGNCLGRQLVEFGRRILEGMLAIHARSLLESVLSQQEQESGSDLANFCSRLKQALEDSKSILDPCSESFKCPKEASKDGPWPAGINQETLDENKKKLKDSVKEVESRILSCEAEIDRLRLEQEQKKLEETEVQKTEIQIPEDSKLKRPGSVSPSSETRTPLTTAQWRPFNSMRTPIPDAGISLHEKESLAAVEHGIKTLLETDSPHGSYSSPHQEPQVDVNLHARDILETLHDPWGVEEPMSGPAFSQPAAQTITRCNLQEIFPRCPNLHQMPSHEIAALFEKGKMRNEHLGLTKNISRMGSLQSTRAQQLAPGIGNYADSLTGSSAFSTVRPHLDPYPEIPTMLPRQTPSNPWTAQSAGVYPQTCPFPGVGIAIPGELNRSLSDKISRNNSADHRNLYSHSSELRRGLTFDSSVKKPFGPS